MGQRSVSARALDVEDISRQIVLDRLGRGQRAVDRTVSREGGAHGRLRVFEGSVPGPIAYKKNKK